MYLWPADAVVTRESVFVSSQPSVGCEIIATLLPQSMDNLPALYQNTLFFICARKQRTIRSNNQSNSIWIGCRKCLPARTVSHMPRKTQTPHGQPSFGFISFRSSCRSLCAHCNLKLQSLSLSQSITMQKKAHFLCRFQWFFYNQSRSFV